MPGPQEHGGADEAIAQLLEGIEGLSQSARERLYLRLLYPSGTAVTMEPKAAGLPSTTLRNPATESDPAADATLGAQPVPPPASKPKSAKPRIVEIRLYDVAGLLPPLGSSFARQLERHLGNLEHWTAEPGLQRVLQKANVSFSVSLHSGEPSAAMKAATQPLVFPVYFMDERRPSPFSANLAELFRIMDEHLVPKIVPGSRNNANIRKLVEAGWGSGLLGIAVPPGELRRGRTPRKCIFMKSRTIAQEARGDATYYGNVVLHEFGHEFIVNDRSAHPTDGSAMNSRLPATTMKSQLLAYNARHARSIVTRLLFMSTMLWLGLVQGGCSSPVRSTSCLAQWEATLCGPCGAPPALAGTEREAVIARLTAALLEADVDRGFLTNDAPLSATETRFYRTSSGPLATVTSKGLRFAPAEATARAYARGRPHHPVTFIDVTSAEVSGIHALYVKVLVVDETWMGEARGHLNERIPAEYCVTVNGDEIEIRTVLAPTHIAASEPAGRRRPERGRPEVSGLDVLASRAHATTNAWPLPGGSAAHSVEHPRRSFR